MSTPLREGIDAAVDTLALVFLSLGIMSIPVALALIIASVAK